MNCVHLGLKGERIKNEGWKESSFTLIRMCPFAADEEEKRTISFDLNATNVTIFSVSALRNSHFVCISHEIKRRRRWKRTCETSTRPVAINLSTTREETKARLCQMRFIIKRSATNETTNKHKIRNEWTWTHRERTVQNSFLLFRKWSFLFTRSFFYLFLMHLYFTKVPTVALRQHRLQHKVLCSMISRETETSLR